MIGELLVRLRAHGFGPGECHRVLAALAGSRVPTLHRVRAWRQIELAAALLAGGCSPAETVDRLRKRYGISTATAYRRIAAVVSACAPSEKTSCDTAASP